MDWSSEMAKIQIRFPLGNSIENLLASSNVGDPKCPYRAAQELKPPLFLSVQNQT